MRKIIASSVVAYVGVSLMINYEDALGLMRMPVLAAILLASSFAIKSAIQRARGGKDFSSRERALMRFLLIFMVVSGVLGFTAELLLKSNPK